MATMPAKRSKLREALNNNYVKTAILIIIVIGGVFSFWIGTRVVLRAENPFMAVASGSMIPTLNVGDLIVVQGGLNFSELHVGYKDSPVPGEIIVYQIPPQFKYMFSDPNELIVHRAVDKQDLYGNGTWYFYTKGDNYVGPSAGHDPWNPIRQDYIIGKVIAKVPLIGQIALFMQTLTGRIIIIALIIVLLVVEFIPFPKKDKEKVLEQEQVKA